jgi:hypothetical protein
VTGGLEPQKGGRGGEKMNLRCPRCNSTNLKKVSLAYQEGLHRGEGHARLRASVIAGSGPDLVVGRASRRAFQQSSLSKQLSPPMKWSYRRVAGWSVLVFLCLGWLVFYTNIVATSATTVIPPVVVFGLVGAAAVVELVVVAWRHNHSTYRREYAEWNRSFICQRCGSVTSHG